VSGRRGIRAGVSLSLSGRFRLQGQAALNGIRLWVEYARPHLPLRLTVYDDGSRADRLRENVLRLLARDRADLLLGPYSSGLTRAAAAVAEAHGKVLWNHGGASDAVTEQGRRRLVTIVSPASDYFRALPLLIRRVDPEVRRIRVLHGEAGTFGANVARGVAEGATAAGFSDLRVEHGGVPISGSRSAGGDGAPEEAEVLVGAGSFEDDVEIAKHTERSPRLRSLAVVAAGLRAFSKQAGEYAEGVIGPSQWEPGASGPPAAGPDSAWFVSAYRKRFDDVPEYVAAQAFAVGVVFAECLRRTGSLDDDRLLAAAHDLHVATFFGRFRIDAGTGKQTGHQTVLVQWREGEKVVIWPPEVATARLAYPLSSRGSRSRRSTRGPGCL
jgi:branched-chain amino acid transport system substrate-binding protein